jgi:hypothetical protein
MVLYDDPINTARLHEALVVGIATGLVMTRSDVGWMEAEGLLLAASDRTGKRLEDVAASYVETGQV